MTSRATLSPHGTNNHGQRKKRHVSRRHTITCHHSRHNCRNRSRTVTNISGTHFRESNYDIHNRTVPASEILRHGIYTDDRFDFHNDRDPFSHASSSGAILDSSASVNRHGDVASSSSADGDIMLLTKTSDAGAPTVTGHSNS